DDVRRAIDPLRLPAMDRIAAALETMIARGDRADAEQRDRLATIDAERKVDRERAQKDRDEQNARVKRYDDENREREGRLPRRPHLYAPEHGCEFPARFVGGRRFCGICGREDRE